MNQTNTVLREFILQNSELSDEVAVAKFRLLTGDPSTTLPAYRKMRQRMGLAKKRGRPRKSKD